jgi:hypothetical protein
VYPHWNGPHGALIGEAMLRPEEIEQRTPLYHIQTEDGEQLTVTPEGLLERLDRGERLIVESLTHRSLEALPAKGYLTK